MTTKEKIEVMQAYINGEKIEVAEIDRDVWINLPIEPVWDWKWCNYRIKPTPKYIPFTFEDREMFRGKWIMNKIYKEFLITAINDKYVEICNAEFSYQSFLDNYTFLDGTPCGKLQQNN